MRTVANGQPLSVGEVKVLIGITRLVAELGDPALRGRSWAVVNGLLGLHLSDGQFEVLVGITDLIAALDNPALRLTKDFIQRAHRIHFEHARDRVVTDVQPVLVELEKLRILRRESGQEPTTYQVRPPDEWLARPILSAREKAALMAEILANNSAQVGQLLFPFRPRPRLKRLKIYDYGSRLGFSGPEIKAIEAVAGDSLLYPECRDMLVDVFSKRIDEVCKLARAFHCAAKRKGMAKWLALGWFFVNKGENRYTIPFKSLTDSQISKLWVDVTPPTERSDPSLRRYARAALTREQVREHISNPPFASQFPSFIILARELTTNQFLDHVIEWGGRKKFTKESAAENAKRMLTRERRSAVDLHFEMERIPRSRGDTARMLCPQKVVAGTGHDVHSRTSEETVAQKKLGPPQGPRPVA